MSNSSIREIIGNWEKHFALISKSEFISQTEKEIILNGQRKLAELFDDEWLSEVASHGFVHPLIGYLANEGPIAQLKLADLGNKLNTLKHVQGFDKLKGRLKSFREYAGAEAEIEIASKLITNGISGIDFSPAIIRGNKPRESDIKAIINRAEIYFEITCLRDSGDTVKAGTTFNDLYWPHDYELIQYIQVHKILASPRIREFKSQIQEAISKVKKTKSYLYVGESGVLDFLAIHPNIREKGKELAKKYNMKPESSGPPAPRDDIRQLKHALRVKSHQLPVDKPGIIILFADLFFFGPAQDFYKEVVYELEDEVYEQSNLVSVIVINNTSVMGDEVFNNTYPHYTLVRKSRNDFTLETILTLRNRYSSFIDLPISTKVLEVLSN